MGASIQEISIYNRFRNEPVDWLLANVVDRIRIELLIKVETAIFASTTNEFILNATDGVAPGGGWVKDDGNGFKDFIIGDTVLYHNKSNGASNDQLFTITEKLTDGVIRLSSNIKAIDNSTDLIDDYPSNDCIFSLATPITALRYKWNFIENKEQDTFKSKVDGSDQELVIKLIDASDVTVLPMIFLNGLPYQTGSATARGAEIIEDIIYASYFVIVHETTVTPYMLAEQWDDLRAGILPPYFKDSKCLKAIFDIQAATDYANPNWIQQASITSIKGNTGGFNENFNTGITNYKVDSIVFKNALGDVLDACELTEAETDFEIHIKAKTGTPFLNNFTKFELQFLKAPFDATEYQNNGRTIDSNFIDDRVFHVIDGITQTNGDQFGVANRQCLKSVVGTFVSASEIKITGKVVLLPGTITVFKESEEPRYIMSVAVQNHLLETKLSDLVRLPVSVSKFYIDISDDTLIHIDNAYFRHYESGQSGEGSNVMDSAMPEDEIVSFSRFYVDKLGREADTILLKSISAKIKVKNSVTLEQFTLDDFTQDLTSLPFINGNQYVDFSLDRIFQIPPAEIRKKIKLVRRTDLDIDRKVYYNIQFPFLMRWEYWVQAQGVNGAFFDQTAPNTGFNHDWFRFSQFAGPDWGVYYELSVVASKNGNVLEPFILEDKFTQYDYDSNPNWDPNTIKSYDPDTLAELLDMATSKKYILNGKDTLIEARFTSTTGTPDPNKIVINMGIEVFEEGGVGGKRRMSSKWASGSETWFKSIDLSNKTIVTIDGDTIVAQVLINKDLIPDKEKFSVMARLYETTSNIICICPVGWTADNISHVCFKIVPSTNNKSGYRWDFGNGAALDLGTPNVNGDPSYTLDGKLATQEGCTGYADSAGLRLFYSDGVKLFDGQNIDQGVVLKGDSSSTQSALALQNPTDPTSFYLFVIDADGAPFTGGGGGNGKNLTYNILTGVTNAGLTISLLNERLYPLPIGSFPDGTTYVSEKMAATANNSNGFWLITKTHVIGPTGTLPQFVVFGIDGTTGNLNTTPQFYNSAAYSASANIGQMKFSTDNKRFAEANFESAQKVALYDFDSATGAISNGIVLDTADGNAYGLEFSPDGTKLYVTQYNGSMGLYQFDLEAGTQADIQASRVYVSSGGILQLETIIAGQLQLHTNGRIYMAHANNQAADVPSGTAPNFLCVIRQPNKIFLRTSGDIVNGNPTIHNIPAIKVARMEVGMLIVATGIPNLAKILTIDDATTITLDMNATVTATARAFAVNGCDYHGNTADTLSVPLAPGALSVSVANTALAHTSTVGLPTFSVSSFTERLEIPCQDII